MTRTWLSVGLVMAFVACDDASGSKDSSKEVASEATDVGAEQSGTDAPADTAGPIPDAVAVSGPCITAGVFMAGTCAAPLGTMLACFAASGACTLESTGPDGEQLTTFASGSTIVTSAIVDGVGTMTFTGPSGIVCGTGWVDSSKTPLDPTLTYTPTGGPTFRLRFLPTVSFECPDGTKLAPEAVHGDVKDCLAPSQCTGNGLCIVDADCEAGQSCCTVGAAHACAAACPKSCSSDANCGAGEICCTVAGSSTCAAKEGCPTPCTDQSDCKENWECCSLLGATMCLPTCLDGD